MGKGGGKSSARGGGGGGAAGSNSIPKGSVSVSQAESMIRDQPGFGKNSEITSAEVTKVNADGTVNIKFTYTTTPGPGDWTSRTKTKVIPKVRTNQGR